MGLAQRTGCVVVVGNGHFGKDKTGGARKASMGSTAFTLRFERVAANPVRRIDRPRKRGVERHAHSPERIRRIIDAQPELRDLLAIALLARFGLLKNELRLLRWRDIDLAAGELRVQAKGGKRPTIPHVYDELRSDLAGLQLEQEAPPEHYLLHPIRISNLPGRPVSWRSPIARCNLRQCTAGGAAASSRPPQPTSRCTNFDIRLSPSSFVPTVVISRSHSGSHATRRSRQRSTSMGTWKRRISSAGCDVRGSDGPPPPSSDLRAAHENHAVDGKFVRVERDERIRTAGFNRSLVGVARNRSSRARVCGNVP